MVFYIDLDSTLNDLIFTWTDWLNRKYNKNIKVSDIKYWNHIVDLYGTEEVFEFFHIEPFERDLIKPLPKAQEFIEELKSRFGKDNITILTDTFPHMRKEKGKWIERHFPDIKYIFTNGNKEKFMCGSDLSVFIDDNPHHHVKSKCKINLIFNYEGCYSYVYEVDFKKYDVKEVRNYDKILKEVSSYVTNERRTMSNTRSY